MSFTLKPVGDQGILLSFGNEISYEVNGKVTDFVSAFKETKPAGIIDIIPAYCTVLISYDPFQWEYKEIKEFIEESLTQKGETSVKSKRVFEIPVCYGGEFGEDMGFVSEHTGLTEEEIIARHSQPDYLIFMMGFLPGFTYLGGMDEKLITPRLENPRLSIPGGSVGIASAQTGIYPLESPGGWQLIGRTPVKPYDPNRDPYILYEAGDYIRFVPINKEEYYSIEEEIENGNYEIQIVEVSAHGN